MARAKSGPNSDVTPASGTARTLRFLRYVFFVLGVAQQQVPGKLVAYWQPANGVREVLTQSL
jgi:hypothetical protein